MPTDEERQQLIAQIERVRPQVIDGLFDEMYQNPFWEARYGEKGKKHTRLDTNYHINQLVTSLAMDLPSLSVQYYHWLQGLLVYRGMCTLHIRDTIDCMARQFSRLIPESWPGIEPYLRAGEQGLVYEHPGCAALLQAEMDIARATTNRMFQQARTGKPIDERAFAAGLRDNRYHLSYLADTVANQLEDAFDKYIVFLTGFLPQHGVSLAALFEDLQVLSEEINATLPPDMAGPFITILNRTLQKYSYPAA